MTVSDILYIVSTVAITQAICDVIANKLVYSTDDYVDAVSTLERMRVKRDKVLAQPAPQAPDLQHKTNTKSIEKYKKRLKAVEDDYAAASGHVSRKHIAPRIYTSIVFFLLYRILSAEYNGKIVALLPFEPWGLIRRFSMRGITFEQGFIMETTSNRVESSHQACNFLFVYILCNMSVKFIVNLVLGTTKTSGTGGSLLDILDDPRGKKILDAWGLDVEEVREWRKNL